MTAVRNAKAGKEWERFCFRIVFVPKRRTILFLPTLNLPIAAKELAQTNHSVGVPISSCHCCAPTMFV